MASCMQQLEYHQVFDVIPAQAVQRSDHIYALQAVKRRIDTYSLQLLMGTFELHVSPCPLVRKHLDIVLHPKVRKDFDKHSLWVTKEEVELFDRHSCCLLRMRHVQVGTQLEVQCWLHSLAHHYPIQLY